MGDAQNHEGAVLNDKIRFGVDMVKITGDFILGGMTSVFRTDQDAQQEALKCKRTIALVPGAYKPPHKEHLNMLKHYSRIANKVFLFVSPLVRGSGEKDQHQVTKGMSEQIWNLYIKSEGLRNVKILPTDSNSPVKTSIDWIANNYKRKDCIILGASTKPDEKGMPDVQGRFDKGGIEDFLEDTHNITDQMVTVLEPTDPDFVYTFTVDMSATDFRKALAVKDYEAIRSFLPEKVDENKILNILGIPPEPEIELEPNLIPESEENSETKKKGTFSSILHGIVEEMLDEADYQKSDRIKDYLDDWRELHAAGPQDPGSAYPRHRPGKRSKSGPAGFAMEEVENEEEIIEEDDLEETNAIEFVAGKKSYEQACYEDPNCRDLQKNKIKITISHPSKEELEEISTAGTSAGGAAVEGHSESPWIKFRPKKRKRNHDEQLVKEVIDYLLKETGA